jgi:hypothetical protein
VVFEPLADEFPLISNTVALAGFVVRDREPDVNYGFVYCFFLNNLPLLCSSQRGRGGVPLSFSWKHFNAVALKAQCCAPWEIR